MDLYSNGGDSAPVVEEPVEAPVDEAVAQELADEQEVLEALDAPAEA